MLQKPKIFIITFLIYVSIHSLRTTYSFSKKMIAQSVQVQEKQLGIVDSLMLYALAIGFFQQAINPYSRPVLTMTVGLFLTAFFFLLIPLLISAFSLQAFSILCVLMSLDGYFQSYVWPNLLMVVNSYFDNKKDAILLGMWSTNTNFGNIFGFIMGEIIVIRAGLQWEIGMYFISFFMIIIGLLTYFGLKELPKQGLIPIKQGEKLIPLENSSQQDISSPEQISSLQKISKLFKSPVVVLITLTFSLIKSVQYGILLWLPMYFDLIGLEDYSAFIPIAFDCASILSSIALGYAFKKIQNKGVLLGPLIFALMLLFLVLRLVRSSVAVYYGLIAGVGLCLGGTYNTLASLVAMELVKVVDPKYRMKYLGFYSAVLMCTANLITATTQILLGYVIGEDEQKIFVIFFWYSAVTLVLLIIIAILQRKDPKQTQGEKQKYIQIVQTH